MAASLSGVYNLQNFTDLGALAAGYRLYTYAAGTTTQKTAYTDAAGTVPHTYTSDGAGGLYIALNSRGELPAPLFLASGGYDIALKTSAGVTVWTRRAIGQNDAANDTLTALADPAQGAALVADAKGYSGAQNRTQAGINDDWVSISDFLPAGFNTSNDATSYIQAALSSGAKVVDFLGIALKCDKVTVPAGIWAKNVNLTKFTAAAGNVVEVNSGVTVTGKIAGTGLVSTIQRCIYPAADGVTDVSLNVDVSNATYGVHAQYITTDTDANRPKRWTGYVYAHDIVGTTGVSEGYGVLLSPANACQLTVNAKTIARHAVYLSAGARDNDITVTVDGCGNYAVQLFSTSVQSPTQYNTVRVNVKNLSETVAGQSGAAALVQKANYNCVYVRHEGNNGTSYAVLVEGSSGGPYPLGNRVYANAITGQFFGADVIRMLNADSTVVEIGKIDAYATNDVIGMRMTGTNGATHAGYVYGGRIDCQGQAIKGIYNECTAQFSTRGLIDIRNNGAALRVDDQTSGKFQGYTRRVEFSGTTASIAAANSGDTTVTLPDNMQTGNRCAAVFLTGSSVQFFNVPFWVGVNGAPSETQLTFRTYNGHAAGQTFNYKGWVEGD